METTSNVRQPRKILHITGGMNRGGAETMIMNIYRSIDRSHLQFDFISPANNECDFDNEIRLLGGQIFNIKPINFFKPWIFIKYLSEIIKKNGPYDAVHAHTLFNIGFVLLIARISGVKLRIAHAHSTRDTLNDSMIRKTYQVFMRMLIRLNSNLFVACGKDAGDYLFGKKNHSNVRIIPNAVDLNIYHNTSSEKINSLKKELNIDNSSIIIGQVGNLKAVKNHRFSILVALELLKLNVRFHMIFAGEGELKKELETMVKENGLVEFVSFIGSRDDVNYLLKVFDLLIMPSIYEGLPVSLIEAQAAGVNCLVSTGVTKESDLGLGLLNFIELEEGYNFWANQIISLNKNNQKISENIIRETFQFKGYDINSAVKLISSFYSH